jgi:hypothetical protein
MARHRLGGSDQPQTKPKQESGTIEPSLHNIATIGASVLAADATKAILNAAFDVQPTNRQVMDKLERVEQMLLSIERGQVNTNAVVDATKGLVADVIYGVAATGSSAQKAIMASQNRRGLKLPKPTNAMSPPKPAIELQQPDEYNPTAGR